ncbi:MAG: sensor hybrid histidine kinase [Labilithrix sp.]|nr:sensor hybrid histidine kinase [Labilithrix sp.]
MVVEDDRDVRAALVRTLAPHYTVTETASAEHALDLVLDGFTFDVIVCDLHLEGWSGADLYKRLSRRGDPHTSRFVILSGLDVAARYPALAVELGERLLAKPMMPAALVATLASVRRAGMMA